MSLASGKTIGPYEIVAPIGAGGMGEVYRARDAKLKRDVALKVLPEAFARDPERMSRFEREAQLLGSLNHPNIAHLYGLEGPALVMELVEGESPKGPMPFDEAWKIASQIADALEYAHERGVIHRDLKPANVKVTADGVVKLLDFGLAKAFTNRGETPTNSENSPTLTMGATEVGVILGTAAYMAPEQARGKTVDKRADIWSFGVVLYELLTGERPFHGEDVSDILASVIKEQPKLVKVPAQARSLIEQCLEKDPKKRLRDIGDARRLLSGETAGSEPASAPSRSRFRWVPWGVAALLLLALTALGVAHFREITPPTQSFRYQISPPGNAAAVYPELSPDGHNLAFVTNNGGPNQIWVRAMDTLEARPLAGTDAATYPFWSSDGAYLGFFADGKLKKIAVAGGPAQTLCDATSGRGGTWNRNGVILFSPGPAGIIFRVSAAGGTPVPVTKLQGNGSGNEGHRFPSFLPDGVHFLYNGGSDKAEAAGVFLGSLNGDAAVRVLPDVSRALYARSTSPTGADNVLFARDQTLMALPFDSDGLKSAGDSFPVAEQVPTSGNAGFGVFSVSDNGILVYRSGVSTSSSRELAWMDRTGKRLGTLGKPADYRQGITISPDEKTAAVAINNASQSDIWLDDIGRGGLSRFTFRSGITRNAVWSPDSKRLVFGFQSLGTYSSDIYHRPADGSGQEELLLHASINGFPNDWSSDGKWIVYSQTGQKTGIDLWLLPSNGDRKPIPYLQTPADEALARFSPDGRWMAYQANESGGFKVYVQAVPPTGAKYQISSAGGTVPSWRADGKELYYVSGDQKLTAVPIKLGATVEAGAPQALFVIPETGNAFAYASLRDGRFLVNVPAGGQTGAATLPLTVVTNWQAVLKK